MKKTLIFRVLLTLVIVAVLATGCSNSTSDENNDVVTNVNKNPFKVEDNGTVILGTMQHAFVNPKLDENKEMLPLSYDGDEVKIEYSVNASGKAKNVGFLIFVNGIPQPYKFDTTEAPYEYMNIFELDEDNKDKFFTFVFNPVTGKKGDTLNVSITSIYNPAFIPDMKETSSYGGYHTTLEVVRPLVFNQNAPEIDYSVIPRYEYLSNVQLSTEPITKELLQNYSMMEKLELDSLDKLVMTDLYIEDKAKVNNYNIQKKNNGTLTVKFKIFGHPGVRYQNTFFINHKVITSKERSTFETVLAKGEVSVIEVDINLQQLEDLNTLYVVSVPINAADFPEDVVVLEKTSSTLLYK